MAEVRNFKLPAVWAQNALTTIPTPPVVNLAYRNANLSADDIEQGQLYGALGNSADWNQMLWLLSAIANEGQNQGILSWSPLIDYAIGAWVMGTNGNAYTALKASGPATAIVNPATEEESEDMTWLDVTSKLQGGGDTPASGIYNTREVLTTSGTYTAPVTGWYKVMCIGGGGGGGKGGCRFNGGLGGAQGGMTTFNVLSAIGGSGGGGGGGAATGGTASSGGGGGGGGAGEIKTGYVYLQNGQAEPYTVGAGGAGATSAAANIISGDGSGPTGGKGAGQSMGGGGAAGASDGISQASYYYNTNAQHGGGTGGAGAFSEYVYGAGGGGGGGVCTTTQSPNAWIGGKGGASQANYGADGVTTSSSATAGGGNGGNGGNGAIILEYYDPNKTA